MSARQFSGVYTAIVTPFTEDEQVDYPTLANLVERQIAAGVQGIVACGTTGESPTLTHTEHDKVIEFVIKKAHKRCTVIAGTGSYSTRDAIEMSKAAEKMGADAVLVVNPYYNKPTQEGLYLHFSAIANAIHIPLIVYNIKGRTGVNVENTTMLRLITDCKNILAVKEASGDLNQMKELLAKRPEYFSVLSGDDAITLELMKAGGDGVICTTSNVVPKEWVTLVQTAQQKEYAAAEKLNAWLEEIAKVAFIETNPIPIKAMLAMMGLCKEVYRLPMCAIGAANREKVRIVLKEKKLIE